MLNKQITPSDNFIQGYHETKQHTGFMFPYNVYLCTIPDDFPSVFLHWQDTMEIIYIKKGTGIAQSGLSVFTVHAGDIVLVPPGCLHGLKQAEGCRMEYENIIFDLSLLGSQTIDACSQKYLLPLQSGQLHFPSLITPCDKYYSMISSCLDDADDLCERRPVGFELGVKADIMKVLSILLEHIDTNVIFERRPEETPANMERLKSIVHYIEEHYRDTIKVEDAALQCGYSASHFMRWFKQMTGTSFIHYLNRFRLEKAYQQLKNTDTTILEIAEQTGFDNLSNFNRQFKKRFGITPRTLRK